MLSKNNLIEKEEIRNEDRNRNLPDKISIDGVDWWVRKNDFIFRNGNNYIYIGTVSSAEYVPHTNCVYVLGERVIVQTCKPKIHKVDTSENKPIKNIRYNDKKLNLTINPEDDELMVIAKNLQRLKEVSVNDFKRLFGDNTTEMNNMKYCLENKSTMSWRRLTDLMRLLNYDYMLDIIDKE